MLMKIKKYGRNQKKRKEYTSEGCKLRFLPHPQNTRMRAMYLTRKIRELNSLVTCAVMVEFEKVKKY